MDRNTRPATDHTLHGPMVDSVYNPYDARNGDVPHAYIMVDHPVRTKAGMRREYIEVNRAELVSLATECLKAVERLDEARTKAKSWRREHNGD